MRNNTADPVELWKAWRVGALPSGVAVAYVVDDSEDLEVTKSITTFSVDKFRYDACTYVEEGCGNHRLNNYPLAPS